jgi:hypothetical protein
MPRGVAGSGEIETPFSVNRPSRAVSPEASEKPQLIDTSPPPFAATHWLATSTAANRQKARRQPLGEPIETPLAAQLANRHPTARLKITLHRVPAAPQLAGNSLRPSANLCNRTTAATSSGASIVSPHGSNPRGELCPSSISVILFFSEGSVSDVVGGSVLHVVRQPARGEGGGTHSRPTFR